MGHVPFIAALERLATGSGVQGSVGTKIPTNLRDTITAAITIGLKADAIRVTARLTTQAKGYDKLRVAK